MHQTSRASTAPQKRINRQGSIDSIPKCVKRHGGIDSIPKTRQTPRRHRPHSENASNATEASAATGWGVFSRQLCGTWTEPQQQGSPGTCGEERRALRPAPGAGRRQPTLALQAPTHQPQPLSRRGAASSNASAQHAAKSKHSPDAASTEASTAASEPTAALPALMYQPSTPPRANITLMPQAPTHQSQPLSRQQLASADASTAPSPSGRPTPNRIILHRRNEQQSRVQPSPRHPVDLVQRLKRIGSARATTQFLHTRST